MGFGTPKLDSISQVVLTLLPHTPSQQVLPSVLEHSGCSAALLVSVPNS